MRGDNDCFVSGGLDKQAGATDLLLAKRSFWFVVALLAGNTMTFFLHSSLETASTLVMKGVVLRLVFVASAFLALFFIEAYTQVIFCVKLRWNAKNIGIALWGLTVALSPVTLLAVVAGVTH